VIVAAGTHATRAVGSGVSCAVRAVAIYTRIRRTSYHQQHFRITKYERTQSSNCVYNLPVDGLIRSKHVLEEITIICDDVENRRSTDTTRRGTTPVN
jgi:hypothetical protein